MFLPSRKSDRGFTIVELLVVILIIGIIAGLGTPSLIGFWRRNQINASLNQLLGAIKETQRQAMRQGRRCRIDINPGTNLLTSNPAGCLLTDRQISDDVNIQTNLPGSNPNISFSHKGSTTRMGTIVLSSDFTEHRRCFVISLGLGIMRTGKYDSSTSLISARNCSLPDN